MKIKKFDVVELNNGNRATIFEVKGKDKYFAEIVNAYGVTVNKRIITNDEITDVVYSKDSNERNYSNGRKIR